MTLSTIKIPQMGEQAIGDYLVARFLERFGNDEIIQEYIDKKGWNFDKLAYTKLASWMDEDWEMRGSISITEYQAFLDKLRSELPKKYRKKWTVGKPWFDNVLPMIDCFMGPLTFEGADKYQAEKALALTKKK